MLDALWRLLRRSAQLTPLLTHARQLAQQIGIPHRADEHDREASVRAEDSEHPKRSERAEEWQVS